MKSLKINVIKDENFTGEVGLVLADIPYDPDQFMITHEGLLIAHDILEHVDGLENIGTVADETQAFGGVYFVRGFNGYIRNGVSGFSIEEALSRDIVGFYEQEPADLSDISEIPDEIQKLADVANDYEYVDEIFDSIAEFANRSAKYFNEDDLEHKPFSFETFLEYSRVWFKAGFVKAWERYKGDYVKAFNTFRLVEDAVNNFVMVNELFEGTQLILSYDSKRAKVRYAENYFDY